MTDIIRNWIFGPSDFDKPDPVKEVKRRKKKVVKVIEEVKEPTKKSRDSEDYSKEKRVDTKNEI